MTIEWTLFAFVIVGSVTLIAFFGYVFYALKHMRGK